MHRSGIIEVDRDNPSANMTSLMRRCIQVLENNKIVGIMPHGGIDREIGEFKKMGKEGGAVNEGAVAIIQLAQRAMKQSIPIIPVGVAKGKDRFVVNVGQRVSVPMQNNLDRYAFTLQLLDYIERLAKNAMVADSKLEFQFA